MSSRLGAAAALAGLLALSSAALSGPRTPVRKPAPKAKVSAKVEPADNSYCFACHVNFKREFLAETHRKAGVGCAKCHGESDKHSSDENNITPPDTMYAPERINAACSACHTPAKLAAAGVKRPNPAHKALIMPAAGGAKAAMRPSPTCTTCHGSHRLPVRTRRWDKTTRKLISDDGVRMLK
jgi:hypothetical protein